MSCRFCTFWVANDNTQREFGDCARYPKRIETWGGHWCGEWREDRCGPRSRLEADRDALDAAAQRWHAALRKVAALEKTLKATRLKLKDTRLKLRTVLPKTRPPEKPDGNR